MQISKDVKKLWAVPRKTGKNTSKSIIIHSGEQLPNSCGVNKIISSGYSSEANQMARLISDFEGTGYELNMSEARTCNRVNLVLNWCIRNIGQKRRLSKKYLELIFGQSQNQLSQYLRDNLLLKLRGHVRAKSKAAEWIVSEGGLKKLWLKVYGTELNLDTAVKQAWEELARNYSDYKFDYSEPTKGGRRYHELQQMPKVFKKEIYAGYWDYDLSASNVTLVTQMAQIAAHHQGLELDTPRINIYLERKGAFRAEIAKFFKITLPEAKEIMQCVFSLAYIDENANSHVFNVLGKNVIKLMNHIYFQEMRAEITNCWKMLMGKNWADGEKRFREYEKYERMIIELVEEHLKGKKYLLQHDGFLLLEKEPLNIDYITRQVFAKTGLDVKLDEVQL